MKLTVLKENDDGSADVKLENINPKMMQLILQTGLIKLLEEAITKAEKENKLPALLKEKTHG
jgi:hypothetical protein